MSTYLFKLYLVVWWRAKLPPKIQLISASAALLAGARTLPRSCSNGETKTGPAGPYSVITILNLLVSPSLRGPTSELTN